MVAVVVVGSRSVGGVVSDVVSVVILGMTQVDSVKEWVVMWFGAVGRCPSHGCRGVVMFGGGFCLCICRRECGWSGPWLRGAYLS